MNSHYFPHSLKSSSLSFLSYGQSLRSNLDARSAFHARSKENLLLRNVDSTLQYKGSHKETEMDFRKTEVSYRSIHSEIHNRNDSRHKPHTSSDKAFHLAKYDKFLLQPSSHLSISARTLTKHRRNQDMLGYKTLYNYKQRRRTHPNSLRSQHRRGKTQIGRHQGFSGTKIGPYHNKLALDYVSYG